MLSDGKSLSKGNGPAAGGARVGSSGAYDVSAAPPPESAPRPQPLIYRPDWPEVARRYEAWWRGEDIGRCGLWVTAPKDGVPEEPQPPEPADPMDMWTNLDYWARFMEWEFRRTFYGGEAMPVWNFGYGGVTVIASFLGASLRADRTTVWIEPILKGELSDVRRMKIDPSSERWQFALRALKFGVEHFAGKSLITLGALGGSGDTLAMLRGTERLLFDVIERPEEVRAAEEYLMDMWMEVFSEFYRIVGPANPGSACWFPMWAPGRFYPAHNDFSYNIGPEMFRDIFLPVIRRQTEFLDHCAYHVDGVNSFRHVDALIELPRLQTLQILPGAGKPSPLHYMDVLKKVQAAGRNLHIRIPCGEVEPALRALSSKGLFIVTSCPTEAEARKLIENAGRWSRYR
ncbi:MAG: hypothetical protein N3A38_06590 [Planctomycetota bacterium]|nr:hypothetical protein [Planctomycetota bacterium]